MGDATGNAPKKSIPVSPKHHFCSEKYTRKQVEDVAELGVPYVEQKLQPAERYKRLFVSKLAALIT